jgi:hypothetical protein
VRILLPHCDKLWRLVVSRYRDLNVLKFFQGNAASTSPKQLKLLEAVRYRHAIRLWIS